MRVNITIVDKELTGDHEICQELAKNVDLFIDVFIGDEVIEKNEDKIISKYNIKLKTLRKFLEWVCVTSPSSDDTSRVIIVS